MPTVAQFGGISIRFYSDEHPPPHFHAVYGEFAALIGIRPVEVRAGSLPPAKLRIVVAWAEAREAVLLRAWQELRAGRKPEKIA